MRLELPVIRLQVQRDRIKPGLPPRRTYTPSVLHEVAALRVTAEGAVGIDADGTEHVDVHNVTHPASRGKADNGISIMTTGDYADLRRRYGDHVVDGIAGESILLDYAPGLAHRAVAATASVIGLDVMHETVGAAGTLTLGSVHVAKPCVEFTRFCLARDDFEVDEILKTTLKDLDDGARGYKMAALGAATIRRGATLVLDLAD